MHKNINQNSDANIAISRFDVTAANGAKCDGNDVARMHSIDSLRHLDAMLRHLSINGRFSGSAQGTSGTSQRYLTESERGQFMDQWCMSYQGIKPTSCLKQTVKCLKPALQTVPSLVTT